VVIRRHFLLLEKSGFIEQRRGPNGGAKLKAAAQEIGVGDVYLAAEGDWLATSHPSISDLLKQARKDGVLAMNEITLAQVLTRMSKGPASPLKAKRKTPKVAALSQRVNQSKNKSCSWQFESCYPHRSNNTAFPSYSKRSIRLT